VRQLIKKPAHVLDRWILSELNILIDEFAKLMDNYQIARAARLIPVFVDKLSNWYIRRSRKRFWKSENDSDKEEAYITLSEVLVRLSQVAAPFMPFLTESMYKNLTGEPSVHLTDYPKSNKKLVDKPLVQKMQKARLIVKLALALRAKHGIKVRQPLAKIFINQEDIAGDQEIAAIICEEVNVKQVVFERELEEKKEIETNSENEIFTGLDTKLTPDLRHEGDAREVVRHIQEMRRSSGYNIDDRIVIGYHGGSRVFNKFGYIISKETLAAELSLGKLKDADAEVEVKLSRGKVSISIKKK